MRLNHDSIELVTLYLRYRNSFNYGFQKFIVWRNMIKFITGINEPKLIRKLFWAKTISLARGLSNHMDSHDYPQIFTIGNNF